MLSIEKRRVLYLSLGDGSDMRVNKEVSTLSAHAQVQFIGVAEENSSHFLDRYDAKLVLLAGRRRSVLTLFRLQCAVARVLGTETIWSVHVTPNEFMWATVAPLLWRRHRVVVDIFDSVFHKHRIPLLMASVAQRALYCSPSRLVVVDSARAAMVPAFARQKVVVIENYPRSYGGPYHSKSLDRLTLYYGGTMTADRGTKLVQGLLEADEMVHVVMAGWVRDEQTRLLIGHPRVKYYGIVEQQVSLELATAADYIVCTYAPTCVNNIMASPNKLYDAIQTRTPVIINPEVRVSQFVCENGLGVVLQKYDVDDGRSLSAELRLRRNTFKFDEALRTKYTWEAVERRLLEAHELVAPGG